MRTPFSKLTPLATAAALGLASAATVLPAFAQTAAPAPAAPAAPASPPPNYNVQYTAFFDGYYGYQFSNPKDNLDTAVYDGRHDTPTLALGELNVFETPKPSALGFKLTIGAGDVADVNAGGGVSPSTLNADGTVNTPGTFNTAPDSNEGQFKNLLQAYGTYAIGGSGAGIDFGKFYTPIGLEVTESNSNFNEGHSIPFDFVPFYHFGVRAYTPSYNGLVLTGYLVQAVYNTAYEGIESDGGDPSFVGNAAWTDPKGKWVINENVAFGDNKYNLVAGAFAPGTPQDKNTTFVDDANAVYNLDASQIVQADFTYASTDPGSSSTTDTTTGDDVPEVTNPASDGTFKATATAWALYYKQILTPKTDFALRYSSGILHSSAPDSTDLKPWEATGTYEYHISSNFTTRFEYQHFGANVDDFVGSTGAITEKSQDIGLVAGLVTF